MQKFLTTILLISFLPVMAIAADLNQRMSLEKASNGLNFGGINVVTGFSGDVRYVDASDANAATGGPGTEERPYSTIDSAVNASAANDVIVVKEGHTESITAAAGIDLDVQGLRVIGLGTKDKRPVVTFTTATAADLDVDAANIYVENLRFVVGVDALASMIDVNSDDFTLVGCEFEEGTAMQAVEYIDVSANAVEIIGNKFMSVATGSSQAIQINGTHADIVIANNVIMGDFSNGGIYSTSAFVDAVIAGNLIRNDQTGDHAIELTGAATGILSDNRLATDTQGTTLDPGSMYVFENYVATGSAVSAVIQP